MSEGFQHLRLRVGGFERIEPLDAVDDLAAALKAAGKPASELIVTALFHVAGYVRWDGHQDRRLGNWFLLAFELADNRVVVAVPQDLSRNVSPVIFCRRNAVVTNLQLVDLITRMIAVL